MNGGADAFSVLGWGLRKYAWLVALFVIAIGLLVPLVLSQNADVYEARAQVGPSAQLNLPNLDPLPRLADSVFNNGAVAEAVREDLQLAGTESVVPSRTELVTAVDNIVFNVVGRGPDPEAAKRLADTAAATFTLELNKYNQSVGQFEIQRSADVPARPVPQLGGTIAIVLGVVAGLVSGVGAVALLLVWRRPVVEAENATEATGAPVFGRVHLARADGDPRSVTGIGPLCRRLLADDGDLILLASPPKATRERHELASAMTKVLSSARQVAVVPGGQLAARLRPTTPADRAGGSPAARGDRHRGDDRSARSRWTAGGETPARPKLVIVDGPTPGEVTTRPGTSVTLLVVRQGISLASLRRSAEQYLDGGPAGLVLVQRASWYQRARSKRSKRSKS